MQNNIACNNFQSQLWRSHVCMNCFQIDTCHDKSQLSRTRHLSEPKKPNGILKRHNLKPLTPEFPPRSYRTLNQQSDWSTPLPQTKLAAPRSCILTRKEIVGNIQPINMDILLQSRTEPDGQLDEPQTNSPPSITALPKKQLTTPTPLKLQAKNSISPGHISDSPVTPQVPPYAVSIVNDQEVQDFYHFNQLEQTYNEKQSTPRMKDPDSAERSYPTKFPLFQVNPINGEECASKPKGKKEPSISTDSGTEMDAVNLSPIMRSRNSLMVTPENESRSFKSLLSPKIRRRNKSDGPKKSTESLDSPANNRSLGMTSCIPIRFPRWPQKKRPKEKDPKSPRRRELCIEDIHVLPPGSVVPQMVQKDKFPKDVVIAETSPQYCGIASLNIEPSGTQTPKSNSNGTLSPIKSGLFSPTGSHSHHYLPLNLVPMSAINSRDNIVSSFPAFSSEHPLEINFGKRSKPFPTPLNTSQQKEEPSCTEYASPLSKRSIKQSKPSRTFRTDNTHLLRYKSKSEMNLGVLGAPSPFYDVSKAFQLRHPTTGSITSNAVKPEIPAFPPNASMASIPLASSGYMQPNQFVAPRQTKYNRHVRTSSLYENADVIPQHMPSVIPEARNLETASASDLLESQTKLTRPPSINTSDSGSYVQMRIDQAISDEIGQAVTMYKKIVTENSKLMRLLSDQLHKQNMQVFEWDKVEWNHVEIVDNQKLPLNIAMLVQQDGMQKEFSLWPKEVNQDDATSRAFQSIQSISSQIPRNQYVMHAHTLLDIPHELREKCPSLQQQQQTCVLDQTRAGTLEQHLIEHKPLLELDPERYELNMMMYIIQILSGVAHMHRHKLVHRDLNLSDILLSRDTEADEILQVKISGFTYALHRPGPPRAQPFLYTFEELQWLGGDETKLPPEITNAQNNVPELNYSGTDCFAVGCLIYEMMNIGNPFEDQNLITKSYSTEELPNFQQRSKYSVWIQKVAKGLLEMNIQRRLDATFALCILQLAVFDGEKLLTDTEISEKKMKAYISELQGKFLARIVEKSAMTLLTGRALELNVLEKVELNFLANSQPYTIVRAVKHFQNIS